MKVSVVWKNDYPWDIRVEKISRTLLSFGHEVHIICRNLRGKKIEENLSGIFVHRLKPIKNSLLNSIFSMPAFFNPVWVLEVYRICKKYKVDVIIVRDLPLVLNGVIVGKRLGIPTVFDMAENYPALWEEVTLNSKFNILNFILKNPILGKQLEKCCIKLVDHILAVVEEAKLYLIELGADKNRISIVCNTPNNREIENAMSFINTERWKGKFVLLYQGYVNKARGLEIAIRSMPNLVKEFGDLLLVIAGDGDDLIRLKILSKELIIDDYVEFLGWVNYEEIYPMILSSNICIIPHHATEHKNTTIPNKLFDYLACEKPVVVSDAKPLKRIVEHERCGLVFASENIESFASAVSYLIHNPSKAQEMGKRGKEAVIKRYNWYHDSIVLKGVVENLK